MTNEELNRIMAQADDRLDAMKEKLIFQEQEIERLKEEIKKEQDNSIYLEEIINKAIENINNTDLSTLEKWKLQEILQGSDNNE